jgi:hypothetical protein
MARYLAPGGVHWLEPHLGDEEVLNSYRISQVHTAVLAGSTLTSKDPVIPRSLPGPFNNLQPFESKPPSSVVQWSIQRKAAEAETLHIELHLIQF